MIPIRTLVVALYLGFLCGNSITAAPLTYSFRGIVVSAPVKPYGLTISGSINGHFSYDPSATSTRTIASGFGYDQHIPDGFHVNIGDVTVSASDYVVEVLNNVVQPDRVTVKDEFIVIFSSGMTPPLTSNLSVNGIARSAGLLSITFLADSSLFPDSSLPSSFSFSNFTSPGIGIFGDRAVGNVAMFTVVPEPDAISLSLIATTLCGALCWARSSRGFRICRFILHRNDAPLR